MQRDRRKLAAVLAVLCAPAVAVGIGACGHPLQLGTDDGDGAADGGPGSDGSPLDGTDIELDGGALACPVSIDRIKISMGEVLLGKSHTETIHLTTTSADTKTMKVVVTGTGFSGPTPPSIAVTPGTAASFDVSFSATAAGPATGQLTIANADDGACSVTVPLDAVASNASFAVSPGTIDLGDVRCGTAPTSTVTLAIQSAVGSPATTYSIAGLPSPFLVAGSATGPVPPSSVTNIPIGATTVPQKPARITSSLDLTIQSEGNARTIPVTIRSQGATVAFNPPEVVFGQGATQSTVDVTNTGNQGVIVRFIGQPAIVNGSKDIPLAQGQTKTVSVVIPGSASLPLRATVAASASPALCLPGSFLVDKAK